MARHTWNATYAHSIAAHNRQQFLDRVYTHKAIRAATKRGSVWFYVAVQAETIVGLAQYLRRCDGQGELVRIYVHPDHQRRGIGRSFLAAGSTAMAEKGINHCHVSVEASNVEARSFYARFGFRTRREYGRFLGNQIIRLVEYSAPIASLLDASNFENTIENITEPT